MSQKKQPAPAPAPRSKTEGLSSLLRCTCMWYTAISVFVLLVNVLLSGNERAYVDPLSFLLFLPFALAMAAAGMVRRADGLTTTARVILHPLLVLGGFYLCIYLPYQIEKKPTAGQMLAIFVLAAVLYGAVVTVLFLIRRRIRQKAIDDTPYTSQFGPRS